MQKLANAAPVKVAAFESYLGVSHFIGVVNVSVAHLDIWQFIHTFTSRERLLVP
jgi:hypothetical protein